MASVWAGMFWWLEEGDHLNPEHMTGLSAKAAEASSMTQASHSVS